MIKKLFSMTTIATLALTLSHNTSAEGCSINVVTGPKILNGAVFNAETEGGSYGSDVVFYRVIN